MNCQFPESSPPCSGEGTKTYVFDRAHNDKIFVCPEHYTEITDRFFKQSETSLRFSMRRISRENKRIARLGRAS